MSAAFLWTPIAPGSDDRGPLYLRLRDRIRGAIERGDLKPHDGLPSERDIAEACAVSRVTVRKALADLIAAGLLHQRQGSGTFVAEAPRFADLPLSRLTSFTEDMHTRGLEVGVEWLERRLSPPSPREAMHLRLSPRDSVAHLKRLRLTGGVPMAIEWSAIPARDLSDPATVGASLYERLDALGLRPVRALQRLSAVNLPSDEADLLRLPAGAAALAIERIAFLADGRPIEFTLSRYRGDAYDFVAELTTRQD